MKNDPSSAGVKLVTSIIYRERAQLEKTEALLTDLFGPAEDLRFFSDFDYTDYYQDEFGGPLERVILAYRDLVPLEKAHIAKLKTNKMEREMAKLSRRTVNIDPGYVTKAKLVLFTTKDYSHRIYAGDGIFAECTLFFQNGVFNKWPWTYPDYASGPIRGYFGKIRDIYAKDLYRSRAGEAAAK
ncbi:MAG: DUF4416 family protein [Candidatus Omnitrophota bacterium]